jgi:large subunit ribosomal protein L20
MTRVKSPSAIKHRKILKDVKGFKQSRSKRIQVAMEARLHSFQYAYEGRKNKKRDLRALWIIRINAMVRKFDLSYSKFINLLKEAKVEIDRKILSEIAAKDEKTFEQIVNKIKK